MLKMKSILAVITLLILSSSVLGFSVARSISDNIVTLTIDPVGSTGVMTVQEKFTGSVVVSPVPIGCGLASKTLTCDYEKTASGTIVYVTSGSGAVSGSAVTGTTQITVSGDSTIPKTAAPCVSSWVEGSWSTCVNGQQTHTVTDNNNCPVPVDKPATSRTCTVAPANSCADTCALNKQSCIADEVDAGNSGDACTPAYNSCVAACSGTASCGNNIKEAGEVCDGTVLDGQTCITQGYASGGPLVCSGNCLSFDSGNCASNPTGPFCGNGKKESGEQCDGADLGTQTCITAGALSGSLGCKLDCKVNVSHCLFEDKGGSNGVQVAAENQQEADLFNRIHDALKLHTGEVLKQISSIADIFRCYIKDSCSLAKNDYTVK